MKNVVVAVIVAAVVVVAITRTTSRVLVFAS